MKCAENVTWFYWLGLKYKCRWELGLRKIGVLFNFMTGHPDPSITVVKHCIEGVFHRWTFKFCYRCLSPICDVRPDEYDQLLDIRYY